jgi:NAD(P)-dependent dehydrogenase (short-subunit alcohol dehydrogenase family)
MQQGKAMAAGRDGLDNERRVAERFSMAGRKALVTGGSVSIGREIALAFAEAGADVAIQYARAADIGFGRDDAADATVAVGARRLRRISPWRARRAAAPRRREGCSAASTCSWSAPRSSTARRSRT